MKPETVKRLQEQSTDFKELIAYLRSELVKCDSLDGLADLTFQERAYEVGVRVRMRDRLATILLPLVGTIEEPRGINPKEYAVDVP